MRSTVRKLATPGPDTEIVALDERRARLAGVGRAIVDPYTCTFVTGDNVAWEVSSPCP